MLKPSAASKIVHGSQPELLDDDELNKIMNDNGYIQTSITSCFAVGVICLAVMMMRGASNNVTLTVTAIFSGATFYGVYSFYKKKAIHLRLQHIAEYDSEREQILQLAQEETKYRRMIQLAEAAGDDKEAKIIDRMFYDWYETMIEKKLFNLFNSEPTMPTITSSHVLNNDNVQDITNR